jgi:hypothetical protein
VTVVCKRADRLGFPEAFALLAVLSFFAARFLPVLETSYRCPFSAIFGIPCMTCGMTHAFVHLAHGQICDALQANPVGAVLAAGAWLFAIADLARLAIGAPFPQIGQRGLRAAVAIGFIALTVNWIYLIVRSLS